MSVNHLASHACKPPSRSPLDVLDFLSCAVLMLDSGRRIQYANSAAENLLKAAWATLRERQLEEVIQYDATLSQAFTNAAANGWSYTGQDVEIYRLQQGVVFSDNPVLHLNCTVTPIAFKASPKARMLLELQPIDQQLKANREERQIEQQQTSRELIRNLAHEIKNPLGGIRGAAQLLEQELSNPDHCEYTNIIIKEVDRLQDLMQRLLSPHRAVFCAQPMNIHKVLERVRLLLLMEFPATLEIVCDYDVSLPEIQADHEQLIQTFLNIARNAAQAMNGQGRIIFRTRAARQASIARRHFRLAVDIAIIDDGPGIPVELRARIFYPLVSGRPEGSGLGLTLAQCFVQQHQGTIGCESRPGHTVFLTRLPFPETRIPESA